ncbi:16S rRNA (uracil(1498)-N(3))-methyltransferase [bacterium]|nr:16S rRNA (uracil(1498)-N(3))-methyltransferase [bacterium]
MAQLEVYRIEHDQLDESAGTAVLTGDEAHHLLRVRRATSGDRVMLIDGHGTAWAAELREVDGKTALFSMDERFDSWREPPVQVHLGLAILKGDHWFAALDGCVQAGVHEVTPLTSERSIAGWKDNKAVRADRRSLEAAKQCGRGCVPPVHPVQPLVRWCIQVADATHKLIAEPGGEPLPTLIPGETAAVAIGPEGGFSDAELEQFAEHRFARVDLGPRRFRAEMAAMVSVARLIGLAESAT